jgi:hypothetical protein
MATRTYGPWTLDGRDRLINEVIEALNAALLGRRLILVQHDTAERSQLMESTYTLLGAGDSVELYTPSFQAADPPARFLKFNVGAGFDVRADPLEHDGQRHTTTIDVMGDFVKISSPYLSPHKGVQFHHYLIVVRDRLDEN